MFSGNCRAFLIKNFKFEKIILKIKSSKFRFLKGMFKGMFARCGVIDIDSVHVNIFDSLTTHLPQSYETLFGFYVLVFTLIALIVTCRLWAISDAIALNNQHEYISSYQCTYTQTEKNTISYN